MSKFSNVKSIKLSDMIDVKFLDDVERDSEIYVPNP